MEFIQQKIPGVLLIKPSIHRDGRGYFVETFRQDLLEEAIDYSINFIQDNESSSSQGVLRGLHYQLPPYTQTKLVRVIEGCILDVAVDIRKNSPTFGQHVAVELDSTNKNQLLIPRGFAHGFVVLSNQATVAYKVDNYYSPEHEQGFVFNDPELSIDWRLPIEMLKVSGKDVNLLAFSQLSSPF